MDIIANRDQPRTVTSRRSIKYRESEWRVHEFELRSGAGDVVCSVAALRASGSLLLWLGAGGPALAEVALGMPGGAAAALLGADAAAAQPLARRLAAGLRRPVYVCVGAVDRLTMPLIEAALVAEMKSRPDRF